MPLKKDLKDQHRMAMKIALYRVLQKKHPGWSISNKAMNKLADWVFDVLEKVMDQAGKCARQHREPDGFQRIADFETAIRLLFPDEISEEANRQGVEALKKYNSS